MKSIVGVAVSVGLAVGGLAAGKPPVQLAEHGVRLDPISVAQARIVDGRFVVGEWMPYTGAQPRGVKVPYYAFDCFGGFVIENDDYVYLNLANDGKSSGDTRWPWDTTCGFGSARWFFGTSYVDPMTVEDVQTEACGSVGGTAVDSLDFAWYWGGGTCVAVFFTSDDAAGCDDGNPLSHSYYSGVAINFGSIPTGGYYFTNIDGLDSVYGIFVQMPAPGGSYLAALTTNGTTLANRPGTQFILWGTGDGNLEPFRAGTQNGNVWDDDDPTDGNFTVGDECYYDGFRVCPDPLGKMVGFLGRRCPADINWDGFVNGNDYDQFAAAFDEGAACADVNGDGFINGNDYDAFALWFDQGC